MHPASCPHERLTAVWVSEIRTACRTSGISHGSTSLTFSVAMVVWHSLCLAEAGAPLLIRSAFGNHHLIVREHLATFLVEAQDRYPIGALPRFIRAEFERYLTADCSATASPASAVRLATLRCWSPFPARIGGSVHRALGDGWLTLRLTFETMCFPPFRFGSGS